MRKDWKIGMSLLDMHGHNGRDPRIAEHLAREHGLKIVNIVQFNLHDSHENYRLIETAVRNAALKHRNVLEQYQDGHYCYLNKMLVVIDQRWDETIVAMWCYDGNYTGVMELVAL